ncbi:MAG: response regulator [Spirochaetales bacterium]|nr:response regulator [Spirochaetales bacterium]
MSRLRTIAFVVFVDTYALEPERELPLIEFFLHQGLNVEVIYFPARHYEVGEVSFSHWAGWAHHEKWSAVIFGPSPRVADLPWTGPGIIDSTPVYFLRALLNESDSWSELEEFLSPWSDPPQASRAESKFRLLNELSEALLSQAAWLTVRGGVELLPKIPFLLQYLSLPSTPPEALTPAAETALLRGQLLEKEVLIRRLQHNEIRYRKYFEEDITGDFLMDLNWRVLDCNKTFAKIFGFPSVDYALGYDLRLLFRTPEERVSLAENFMRLMALDYCELELLRPDGYPVNIIANFVGIREEGKLAQVRGFLFDNTPRKNLEKQLRESQKMEGLGRLAGGVAHDFNNLLTVINGYAELLLADLEPEAPQANELGEILHAGLKAAELTRQLLAFSRRQVLTPRVLDLNHVVRQMETMLQRLMTERIRLSLLTETEKALLKADKGQLEQVVLNLVLNARDAMPQGGLLTVRTSYVVIESSVYDSASDFLLPGNYVCLEVSDTGVGMDEEVRKRIFEPFFTTKAQGKGTGLGLATVYGIVQQSGGSLKLDTEPGRGSTFSLYFEAWGSNEEPVSPLEVPTVLPQGAKETIALVEDETMVREYTRRILVRSGYQVLAFSDGHLALEALKTDNRQITLVVTDIVMPLMTGPELEQKLRSSGIDIPFLYMSGYTDDEIIRHGVSANQVMFIHKPFKSKDLLEKIRQTLDQRKESRP